jgi:chromosome segregation ATPase
LSELNAISKENSVSGTAPSPVGAKRFPRIGAGYALLMGIALVALFIAVGSVASRFSELDQLKERKAEIQKDVERLTEEKADIQSGLLTLEQDREALRKLKSQIQTVERTKNTVEKDLTRIKSRHSTLKADVDGLKAAKAAAKAQNEDLKLEIREKSSVIDQRKSEQRQLRNDIAELENEKKRIAPQIDSMSQQRTDHRRALTHLDESIKERRTKADNAQRDLTNAEAALAKVKIQRSEYQGQIEARKNEIDDLKAELQSYGDRTKAASEDYSAAQSKSLQEKNKLDTLLAGIANAEKLAGQHQRQVQELEGRLRSLNADKAEQERLKSSISNLRKKEASIKSAWVSSTAKLDEVQRQGDVASAKLAELVAVSEAARREESRLKSSVQSLDASEIALRKKTEDASTELKKRQRELDQVDEQRQKLIAEVAYLDTKRDALVIDEAAAAENQKRFQQLKANVLELIGKRDARQRELNQVDEQRQKLIAEVANLDTKRDALVIDEAVAAENQKRFQQLKADVLELIGKRDALQQHIAALNELAKSKASSQPSAQ